MISSSKSDSVWARTESTARRIVEAALRTGRMTLTRGIPSVSQRRDDQSRPWMTGSVSSLLRQGALLRLGFGRDSEGEFQGLEAREHAFPIGDAGGRIALETKASDSFAPQPIVILHPWDLLMSDYGEREKVGPGRHLDGLPPGIEMQDGPVPAVGDIAALRVKPIECSRVYRSAAMRICRQREPLSAVCDPAPEFASSEDLWLVATEIERNGRKVALPPPKQVCRENVN